MAAAWVYFPRTFRLAGFIMFVKRLGISNGAGTALYKKIILSVPGAHQRQRAVTKERLSAKPPKITEWDFKILSKFYLNIQIFLYFSIPPSPSLPFSPPLSLSLSLFLSLYLSFPYSHSFERVAGMRSPKGGKIESGQKRLPS